MKIALDAMGGDRAPAETVAGALAAADELGVGVVLVGQPATIEAELAKARHRPPGIEVFAASDVISMEEDHIVQAVRQRRESSINVALQLVRDGAAQGFVSAGNSGAVMAAATFGLGRIPGVERPALATLLPYNAGRVLFLDIGANPDCKPNFLVQFAQMGSAYVEKVLDIPRPRVGLLNVGTEDSKGNDLVQEAFDRLRETDLNFIGNVEPVDLHKDIVDVLVADGFTGNISLKVGEGIADYILQQVRDVIKSSPFFALPALMVKPALRRALKRLQYEEYGGANLLGVNGVVVIAHGRSDASAIVNAIKVAKAAAQSGYLDSMRLSLAAPAAAGRAGS